MSIELLIFLYLSLALLSLVVSGWLTYKYFKDKKRNFKVHSLMRLLAFLTFFMFLDAFYYTLLHASQNRYLPVNIFFRLSVPSVEALPKIGIFLSTVLVVHFIVAKKIEHLKDSEQSISKLEKLNHELKSRAKDLEKSQDHLQKKVEELERFNEVAKRREEKMLDLIKKIETLEKKLKKSN